MEDVVHKVAGLVTEAIVSYCGAQQDLRLVLTPPSSTG
jgi:hypothetical protein